jgi:hypothetical protein
VVVGSDECAVELGADPAEDCVAGPARDPYLSGLDRGQRAPQF